MDHRVDAVAEAGLVEAVSGGAPPVLGVNSKETAVTGDASSRRRQPMPWRIALVSQRLVAGLVDAGVITLLSADLRGRVSG
jgi:hypothetical protein